MKITATRQLTGDYGVLVPGESCVVRDDIGKHLIHRGLATPYTETKITTPETTDVQLEATAPKIANKGK